MGIRKDFEKAFYYFNMAMRAGRLNAFNNVAYMYYYGLGIEQSHKKAYDTFLEGVRKNSPHCYNGLGLMYMRGDFVKEDLAHAYHLFECKLDLKSSIDAAEKGISAAQFNLASLIMYEISEQIQPDLNRALKLLDLAARQGHVGAMYALSVVHLEGHEHYHSCTLSLELMFGVIRNGKYSDGVSYAKYLYTQGKKDQSGLLYLEGGYLGMQDSLINSAVLIDRYKFIRGDKSVLTTIEENKEIFNPLLALYNMTSKELRSITLEDLEPIAYSKNSNLLELRLPYQVPVTYENVTKGISRSNLNYNVTTRILTIGKKDSNAFALSRLGDYYYYGKHSKGQSYRDAFSFYMQGTHSNSSLDFKAQSHLSVGWMYQFGKGVERDLEKANQYYTKVSNILLYNLG